MLDRTQRTIQIYDSIAKNYSQKILQRSPLEEVHTFSSLLPQGAAVLDVGCAAGRDCRIFADMGYNVTGIDLSDNLLKIARLSNPDISFIKSDMRKLPFEDETFAGVWACTVLHHLEKEDMIATLQEFHRVLHKKGVLYLSTRMGEGVMTAKDPLSADIERQFTLLEKEELEEMMEEVGFRKIALRARPSTTKQLHLLVGYYRK